MNRLAASLSPYLLAHSADPVDWYPWGIEAFAKAKGDDRPILLSIGYSACHWCHVMQHESFQDDEIARTINRDFVAIKVDREELPDVDQIYQAVCQAVTGQGGWPLTVFLTPELGPFAIGTYHPPKRRYGRPGLDEVLSAVRGAYRTRRDEVEQVAASWSTAAETRLPPPVAPLGTLDADRLLAEAWQAVMRSYDAAHGGFGGAPKFPQAPNLSLLLRRAMLGGGAQALAPLRTTLLGMAKGGVYDQLGGGFHRYAVDEAWRVPHFEKMLEDQALLAQVYTAFWRLSGEDWARKVAEGTLGYVDAVLSDRAGGFYIAQDADSPGGEGAYYRFPADELERILGRDSQTAVLRYGLDDPELATAGVLQDARDPGELAGLLARPEQEVELELGRIAQALRRERGRRPPPACDHKVLAGATGLAISAFATLGAASGDGRWLARAARAADFCLAALRETDGTLLRRYYEGQAGIPAYLEDYAGLGQGLLDLYLADGNLKWLDAALALARQALAQFWDAGAGVLYSAPLAAATPILRPTDRFDGAKGAAQSRMLRLMLLLDGFAGDLGMGRIAERIFASQEALWSDHPAASPSLVEAHDLFLRGAAELTIAAPAHDSEAAAWLLELRAVPLPDLLATWRDSGRDLPIWHGKTPTDGRATLYACRLGRCSPPLHDLATAIAFVRQAKA